MLRLPDRVAKVTETTIVRRALIELNRLPNVRAMRNNNGKSPAACEVCRKKLCPRCFPKLVRPIQFGLGLGSTDVVGIITIGRLPIGVAFGLEFKDEKWKSAHSKRQRVQLAWRETATRRGMLCARVTSVPEAVAAVEGFRVEMTRRILVLP